MTAQPLTADLSYLTGRTRLECLKDGFESIPAGTLVPLSVVTHTFTVRISPPLAPGVSSDSRQRISGMSIQITAPDGTRHQFHTHPEFLRRFDGCDSAALKHHPIATFVEFFHAPVPDGLARPANGHHHLLDLLEAITTAATAKPA